MLPVSTVVGEFAHDLNPGTTDPEVILLQTYLDTHGYIVATSGVGSLGHESSYFGLGTKAALMEFQKAKGIVPVSGYFGPLTRAAMSQ